MNASICPGETFECEAPPVDRQREGPLDLLAGPDAAGTDDALAGVEGEIGIRGVLDGLEMVLPLVAVADLPQPHGAGHVLQLAVAVGGTGEAVERDGRRCTAPSRLGADRQAWLFWVRDLHPRLDGRGAGRGEALAALDLDQAEAAASRRPPGCRSRRASESRCRRCRGAHHRGAFGHRDRHAVDRQSDQLHAWRPRPACRSRGRRIAVMGMAPSLTRPADGESRRRQAEILREMLERAQHRERRHPAQRAQRAVQHRVAQVAEQRAACAVTSRGPAMIRSITSTPRIEPMRQGVHLPQDSMAQNSIA